MKILIGEYYLNKDGKILYVFGEGSFDELSGNLHFSPTISRDQVKGMIAINITDFLKENNFLQFQNIFFIETVFCHNNEVVGDPEWSRTNPDIILLSKFEKSFKMMDIIKKFLKHMYETYRDKYKDEKVYLRDVVYDNAKFDYKRM